LKSVLGVESSICGAALTRRNLSALDENELFMELIRDVANELDINVLCHKILVNVELLTHADRGSLFLARGPREARYLVAKLFDVTVDTGNKKQQFHILCVSPIVFCQKQFNICILLQRNFTAKKRPLKIMKYILHVARFLV
jgi:hypothetical protein